MRIENVTTEQQRLAAVRSYGILDTPREEPFDRITALVARTCNTDYAVICIVEDDRLYFKSANGLDLQQAQRSGSFCDHVVRSRALFVVPDTTDDPRFAQSPFVIEAPFIRFYAGVPLINAQNHVLGTLCILDRKPQQLPAEAERTLHDLAAHVVAQLELRRKLIEVNRQRELTMETEQQLKFALEGSTLTVWDWNLQTQRVNLNKDWAEVLGPRAVWRWIDAKEIGELIPAEDMENLRNHIIAALKGTTPSFYVEHRMREVSGNWRWVLSRGKVTSRSPEGRALRVAGTFEDITRRKRAEHHVARERNFSQTLMNSLPGILMLLDEHGLLTRWNSNLERASSYSGGEIASMEAWDFFAEEDKPVVEHRFSAALTQGSSGFEAKMVGKNGAVSVLLINARLVELDGRRYVACIGTDITEQKRAEQRAEFLATRDALTGLPNRALLRDRLYQGISQARRHARQLGLMFIDLDRFKTINDSMGHHLGDQLLKLAAHRILGCLRQNDTLARLGGDEFVVALGDLHDTNGAAVVARKIIDAVAHHYDIDGQQMQTSCSIGIALFPDHGEDPDTLMKHADTAMYQAKANGRGTFEFFSPALNAALRERVAIETDLRRAIVHNQLVLHYQPKIDLSSGQLQGLEALVRWQHPSKGLMLPDQFIPIAEETGLIVPLGEWVLRAACQQLSRWRKDGFVVPSIAVNLSAVQLIRKDAFLDLISGVVEHYGFEPGSIELEITESMLLHDAEGSSSTLKALGQLGIGLTIDDFGTGYSSLGYIKKLPIDALKIDKSFIDDLADDPDNSVIVSAITAMAHQLDLRVVAEGVETEEQVNALRALSCDQYQGYYYSQPLPAAMLEPKLRLVA